jgi:hypothetical protein
MVTDQVAKNDTVLHKVVSVYSSLIEELKVKSNGVAYSAHFLLPDIEAMGSKISDEQMDECFRVYLLGVLERCHLTSITSLARANSWLKSSLSELESGNLLGFSASLRGLLEATADTHDVSDIMVNQLYNLFPFIYLRVKQRNNTAPPVVLKFLEDRLIHFSYARRQAKGSVPMPEHTNKTNAQYIKAIEDSGAVGAKDLYQLLCELTHPAAPSVGCFLKESERDIVLDFSQEDHIINKIITEYSETIKSLVTKTVNSALVSIILLRKLGVDVPAPRQEYFSDMPVIVKIFSRVDDFLLSAQGENLVFSESMWHYKLSAA